MQLPRLRKLVEAVLVFILVYSSAHGQVVTMLGTKIPWKHPEPVNPGYPTKTMFWDRLVHIILTKEDTRDGCIPITTGVIIDKNRVLTAFNPFRLLSQNASVINDIIIQVNTGRNRIPLPDNTVRTIFTWNYHELVSGRQITFSPDEEVPVNSWHGIGYGRHTALHDLMVLRVKPDFNSKYAFCALTEAQYSMFQYASLDGWINVHYYVFQMPIAKPGQPLIYPLRYAQLNLDQNRELQFYDEIKTTDNFEVECKDNIPAHWGHFICTSNYRNLRGIASGAVLVSKETVFGIGSFWFKKVLTADVLVFTDVRPYHDLIMQAMTNSDTD